MPNWRPCSNCREDGAHEILKEATTVSTELFSEEAAVFFHGTITDGSLPRTADRVLKNLKLKIFRQPHDDVLLTTDSRFKHYKANEDRSILKDGLLIRKNYGETGSVKYYQILIPKQLVNEVLRNLHGEVGKHPGITKTIIAYREKYYYLKMAQLIWEWVMSCVKCIRELRINPQLTRPPLQSPNEHNNAP